MIGEKAMTTDNGSGDPATFAHRRRWLCGVSYKALERIPIANQILRAGHSPVQRYINGDGARLAIDGAFRIEGYI